MKKLFQKHQILESLDDLDQAQTEQVLQYIKRLADVHRSESHYEVTSKREAMQQIRQALTNQKTLQRIR
jgi:hypothetical protein